MTNTNKPEIDSPANGDFASYIERLNEGSLPPSTPNSPLDAPPTQEASKLTQPSELHELLKPLLPLQGLFHPVRQVLLGLMGFQLFLLVFFSWGSIMNILSLGAMWWAAGWLSRELALLSPNNTASHIDTQALREAWQRLIDTLKAGAKK